MYMNDYKVLKVINPNPKGIILRQGPETQNISINKIIMEDVAKCKDEKNSQYDREMIVKEILDETSYCGCRFLKKQRRRQYHKHNNNSGNEDENEYESKRELYRHGSDDSSAGGTKNGISCRVQVHDERKKKAKIRRLLDRESKKSLPSFTMDLAHSERRQEHHQNQEISIKKSFVNKSQEYLTKSKENSVLGKAREDHEEEKIKNSIENDYSSPIFIDKWTADTHSNFENLAENFTNKSMNDPVLVHNDYLYSEINRRMRQLEKRVYKLSFENHFVRTKIDAVRSLQQENINESKNRDI